MQANSRRDFLKTSAALAAATSVSLSPVAVLGQAADATEEFLKAVGTGDFETAKRLFNADNSLISARDKSGRTGYAIALLAGHGEIASWLVQSGYESDLHESALALDWKRFDKLASGTDMMEQVNRHHPIGGTAMYAAAAGGAGSNIWRVYAKSCDPNLVAKESNHTPLQMALSFSDLETAELTAFSMLSNSTDPNGATKSTSSPLHIAAKRGSLDMVEMLIRLGANVDTKDAEGKTSLDVARAAKHDSIVAMLENHQAIPRTNQTSRAAIDRSGAAYVEPEWDKISQVQRGSFVGLSHSNLAGIKKLIGQDKRLAHSVATTSEKAVEAGAHMGNKPIVDTLLDAGAPYSLPTAVMMGDLAMVKRSLDQAPDRIQERGAHDFALLFYPIIGRCDLDMLQLLLDRGANVEQQSQLGTTALHWACKGGNVDAVQLLIDNGANVKRVGRKFGGKKQTPLQLSRNQKIIDLLKSNGA